MYPSDSPPAHGDLAAQINKRLTLNLLIQGAAAHTFVTASHLVSDQLERLQPGLTATYDRFAISEQLNYCIGDNALMFGRPNRWWGFSRHPQKPFAQHRLLATYGNMLARHETRQLRQRARGKRLVTIPLLHWFHFMGLVFQISKVERGLTVELENLAVQAASQIWQIPEERLDGKLTQNVAFGNLQTPRTALGRMCRQGVIGYGGVQRQPGTFMVVARAWMFPILLHELVKGIMELICLHGLSELEDDVYHAVIHEADQLEYEAWLLQAGPEMWRRLLAVAPRDRKLAKVVMQIARLDPESLEQLMLRVIEDPPAAQSILHQLGN